MKPKALSTLMICESVLKPKLNIKPQAIYNVITALIEGKHLKYSYVKMNTLMGLRNIKGLRTKFRLSSQRDVCVCEIAAILLTDH